MGLGTWFKGLFKIGSRTAGNASSAAKVTNFNRVIVEKGGRYYAEGAKAVGKAAEAAVPGITTATKTITAGAVAMGALVVATLSGVVTYVLTSKELIPGTGLSLMDIIILIVLLVVVIFVIRKVRSRRDDGYEPPRNTGGYR